MIYLDWDVRINIVFGVVFGLLYIYDCVFLQILYKEFKVFNVLLDQNYMLKLVGYGLFVVVVFISKNYFFIMVRSLGFGFFLV